MGGTAILTSLLGLAITVILGGAAWAVRKYFAATKRVKEMGTEVETLREKLEVANDQITALTQRDGDSAHDKLSQGKF